MIKLKIISDGTAKGTKVVNAETGEELKHVSEITWQINTSKYYARATLEIDCVAFEGEVSG